MPPRVTRFCAQRFPPRGNLLLLSYLLLACYSSATEADIPVSTTQTPERAAALRGVRKTLQDYSQMLAERMLANSARSNSEDESSDEDSSRQNESTSAPSTSTAADAQGGVLVGSTKDPSESADALDAPLSRRLRSTYGRHSRGNSGAAADTWSHHHHRRRRKGCPPLHGKDQLLCPSRNTHRYDVCISQ
ncbi:hypothetical protein AAVH_35988, partial [Aphelenchoides avenae]